MFSRDVKSTLSEAKRVLLAESEAVADLVKNLDDNFYRAVEILYNCQGRVIISGMGKSGLVGRKIASTLASTGTPAVFLHPAEGVHGDLGVMTENDVAIVISYSGATKELLAIIPFFKRFGVKTILLSGITASALHQAADCFLNISVESEACPLGITPTSSSTATLAMGDALAMALLRWRDFKREDFALRHPGGSLGRQLLLKVDDLLHRGDELPVVNEGVTLKEALFEMSRKRMGMTTVVDQSGKLRGIVTDGDLRRIFEQEKGTMEDNICALMTKNPKTIDGHALATEALRIMEQFSITSLLVLAADGSPEGVIHIHDILKAGVK